MKKCTKCREIKEVSLFSKNKLSRDGLRCSCKSCDGLCGAKYRMTDRYKCKNKKDREKAKKHRIDNSEMVRERDKRYRLNNLEKVLIRCSLWREKNKNHIKEYNGKYREENASKIKAKSQEYYKKNKNNISEYIYEYRKKYYIENKDKILKYRKEYNTKNKVSRNKKIREKYSSDIEFKLSKLLRTRITGVIKKGFKPGSAVRDLGCSVGFLKEYLEKMFYDRKTGEIMSWDNYGRKGWHMDHIKPLSSFGLTKREELLKACNYKNLQPLWAEDNLSKSNRLDWSKK